MSIPFYIYFLHSYSPLFRQNPDISKRKSRLHYPNQVDPIYREIHELWNSGLDAARGNLEGGDSIEEDGRDGSVEEGAGSGEASV